MNFTTQLFIFVFVPIALILYFLAVFFDKKLNSYLTNETFKKLYRYVRLDVVVMILLSLLFYGWAGLNGIYFLLIYSIAVYLAGMVAEYTANNKVTRNLIMTIVVISFIGLLFFYKYIGFTIDILNRLTNTTIQNNFGGMWVPLGISFITFSAISYLVDIYTGKATKGTLLDTMLYIMYFPKVISGPIVLWRDFQIEKEKRQPSLDSFEFGMNRIMIGFGKKIIIADYFASVIADIQKQGMDGIDLGTAWLFTLLYMMRIYYDFSGYSDIAIGVSNLLGIKIKENFNFPYTSLSVTEFWRRWHISLGTWFKEYIYIPLGGNRKGKIRTLINLGIVFLVTGIWHGASINYILWGTLYGVIIIIERCIKDYAFYKKIPNILKWGITMFIVNLLWQMFLFTSFSGVIAFYKVLFGINTASSIVFGWQYFLNKKLSTILIISILGSTVFRWKGYDWFTKEMTNYQYIIRQIMIFTVFVIAVIAMYNSNYSPFIYFQY